MDGTQNGLVDGIMALVISLKEAGMYSIQGITPK